MSNSQESWSPSHRASSGIEVRTPIFEGVCPVLETPFDSAGEVDYPGFVNLVDHMINAGVRSVMFPGFASEYLKLDEAERGKLTALLLARARRAPGFVPIISIADHAALVAERHAVQAVEAGALGINILPPHLLAPSPAAVREHIVTIARAVAPIPVIVQYAPAQTGTALDARTLADLSIESPNIRQVKVESSPPGTLISALLDQDPALSSVVGYGGVQLIDALRRGAVGVQPGCSFVELYLRVWKLWSDGEYEQANDLHARMLPYLSYWMQGVELIVAAEKRISWRRGLIESDYCRAPCHQLDLEEQAMVDRFMAEFQPLLTAAGPTGGPASSSNSVE